MGALKMKVLFALLLCLASFARAGLLAEGGLKAWELTTGVQGYAPTGATPLQMVGTVTFDGAPFWRRGASAAGGFLASTNYLSTSAAADLPPQNVRDAGWCECSVVPGALGVNADRIIKFPAGNVLTMNLAPTTSTVQIQYTDDAAAGQVIGLAGALKAGVMHTIGVSWDNPNTKVFAATYREGVFVVSGTNTANKIRTTANSGIFIGANNTGLNAWTGQINYCAYGSGYRENFPVRWYNPPPWLFQRPDWMGWLW